MDRLLKSKFKIKEKIGENPFSLTYLGTTLSGEKPVVIKIYKRGTLNSVLIKSMKQKVKQLQEIAHPGIARLLDGDYGWQGFYYVREYVNGLDLAAYLKAHRPAPEDSMLLLGEIASAIQFAHRNGIIHGALKPRNIFIDEDRKIRITDFVIEGEIKESMPQKAAFILESGEYASPEEILGNPARESSDIYSLGLVLLEMLTGSNPFRGLPQNKLSGRLPSLPPVPKYIDEILYKALSIDPLLRFSTVEELEESIKNRSLVELKSGLDLPPVELENAQRPEEKVIRVVNKERKRSFFLAGVALLGVLAGIIYAIINSLILARQ
ncbi:MAG TPA: serine/threonine-protein kinase [Candidatus Omnitrophota bacterium]|nr:serine/threonine-protein kinase [Candidatus Omnitrophota bacterium]